jgi:SAM-dependent methyltransferase
MRRNGALKVSLDERRSGYARPSNLVKLRERVEKRRALSVLRRHQQPNRTILGKDIDKDVEESSDGQQHWMVDTALKLTGACSYQAEQELVYRVHIDSILGECGLQELFLLLDYYSSNPDELPESTCRRAVKDVRKRINLRLDEEEDPRKAIFNLFESWAETYDPHMAETMHDRALETLLKQSIELRSLNFGGGDMPIMGTDILEMSGGTGTVIKLLCDNMTADEIAKLNITINDLSPAMKSIAWNKLHDRCNLRFASHDLRDHEFEPDSYDAAILSQTLHLITDPELIRREKGPDPVVESPDHRKIKTEVIRKAFRALRWDGFFAMIDEWPAKLSDNPRDPMEMILSRLFKETFKPISERTTFRTKVMDNIQDARFVAELKARIDSKHSMYMLLYRKDIDRRESDRKQLPATEEAAEKEGLDLHELDRSRAEATFRIINAFVAIDKHFIETYTPVNGERDDWTNFIPLVGNSVVNPSLEDLQSEKFDAIVISSQLHAESEVGRRTLLDYAVQALNKGGALMMIDEWDPPKHQPHPISMHNFRNSLMERYQNDVIYEASLRQRIMPGYDSGMHGFLFRKIH